MYVPTVLLVPYARTACSPHSRMRRGNESRDIWQEVWLPFGRSLLHPA